MGYETEAWREPKPKENETVLFSEHGRIIGRTDFRSHWFVVVKEQFGRVHLLVKHGGGDERFELGYRENCIGGIEALTSDQRFLLFWTFLDIKHDAERNAQDKERLRWSEAAAEKRIKTRKMPGQSRVRVTIAPKVLSSSPYIELHS